MFWVSEGLCDRETADRLGVAPTTALEYLHRAMTKLGAKKRPHAVKLWISSRIARSLPWQTHP